MLTYLQPVLKPLLDNIRDLTYSFLYVYNRKSYSATPVTFLSCGCTSTVCHSAFLSADLEIKWCSPHGCFHKIQFCFNSPKHSDFSLSRPRLAWVLVPSRIHWWWLLHNNTCPLPPQFFHFPPRQLHLSSKIYCRFLKYTRMYRGRSVLRLR